MKQSQNNFTIFQYTYFNLFRRFILLIKKTMGSLSGTIYNNTKKTVCISISQDILQIRERIDSTNLSLDVIVNTWEIGVEGAAQASSN